MVFEVDTRGDSQVSAGESGIPGMDGDIGVFLNSGTIPGVPLKFGVETASS